MNRKVTNFKATFGGCKNFNQNLNSWDVSNVSNFTNFLGAPTTADAVTLSTANYDALLIGWAAQTLQPNVSFSGGDSIYTPGGAAETARGVLTGAPNNWIITDGGDDTYTFADRAELDTGIALWISDQPAAITAYGPINTWNVTNVTSMNALFEALAFNSNINEWDVSNVTSMIEMFRDNAVFNQPLNSWDVSNVTSMNNMFRSAASFNQDIGSWDVSSVSKMLNMFSGATLFNNGGATLTWTAGTGTATVDNMSGMFFNADAFNSNISGWDVSSVTNMVNMFNNTALFNQDLSSWVVTQTTNCTGFSTGASSWVLNQPNFTACTP